MITRDELDRLVAKGHLAAKDVSILRQGMYGDDGAISSDEADALFRINDSGETAHASWADFFVEALVDYIVLRVRPSGYVSDANARWLMARIAADGRVKGESELELLVRVIETARKVPEALEQLAMDEVKKAVLTGEGPLRNGRKLEKGRISRDEVELLRRVLYGYGGSGGITISTYEAQALFEINDAVTDLANDASWPDLFVKAIANYLMAARGYEGLTRDEALRREDWLDSKTETGVGAFFGRIAAGGLRGVIDACKDRPDNRLKKLNAEIAAAEKLSETEADWLIERLQHDGKLCDTEKALLMFIKAESPDIHPRLTPLLDKVG